MDDQQPNAHSTQNQSKQQQGNDGNAMTRSSKTKSIQNFGSIPWFDFEYSEIEHDFLLPPDQTMEELTQGSRRKSRLEDWIHEHISKAPNPVYSNVSNDIVETSMNNANPYASTQLPEDAMPKIIDIS